MALQKTFKLNTSNSVSIPEGSHIGLLRTIVHIGLQENTYKGETSIVDQVFLQFELQDILTDTGRPLNSGKLVKNSTHDKANLTDIVRSLGGDVKNGFDFESLIGKSVMVNYGLNQAGDKTVIKSFSPLPALLKKAVKPLSGTPLTVFDVETITEGQLSELPEWIKEKIANRITASSNSQDTDDTLL